MRERLIRLKTEGRVIVGHQRRLSLDDVMRTVPVYRLAKAK
mgnify:CR=1 FL=1